jgi:hypothetical protein
MAIVLSMRNQCKVTARCGRRKDRPVLATDADADSDRRRRTHALD